MRMVLNMAGVKIAVRFSDDTKPLVFLFHPIFRDFLDTDQRSDMEIRVRLLRGLDREARGKIRQQAGELEKILPLDFVKTWLREQSCFPEGISFTRGTIATLYRDGLLLFEQETGTGTLIILRRYAYCVKSFHRLLWIYFAQALGERGLCFIHGAAIVRGDRGFLFMGDSGAGKSTLAGNCPKNQVLSDDGPIFHGSRGNFFVSPSPYHQMGIENGLDKDIRFVNALLSGFYFLQKSKDDFVEPVPKNVAFSMVLKRYIHFFSLLSARARSKIFERLFEAIDSKPAYNFYFQPHCDIGSVVGTI
jgi:hypothetical protein